MRMRIALACAIALILGAASAFAMGCGGKKNPHLIPGSRADRLRQDVDSLQSAVDSHNCGAAARALRQLQDDAANLPVRVDPRLRIRIQQGISTLNRQALEACAKTTSTETVPTTTTEVPTIETTTTAPPTTTTTAPPPTTPNTTPTISPPPATTPSGGTGGTGGAGVTTP